MEPVVCRLAARYLVSEKRKDNQAAYDPVANFHLRNGAFLHQLNFRGDKSYRGLQTSLGMMCNYNYVLEKVESNNEPIYEPRESRHFGS